MRATTCNDDANQGPQITFAALGVNRRGCDGRRSCGGDELYAAPSVAVRFAMLVRQSDPAAAKAAWNTLEHDALDLGAPGRDPVFGYGLLAPLGAQPTVAVQ